VVCLYDPVVPVGGILHALLPGLAWSNNSTNKPTKFVDRGIPVLIDALVALGARSNRLTAQLCGGARMINGPGFNNTLNIGRRNVRAAQTALHAAGLEITAKAIGGRAGRTVKLYLADGRVTVKTLEQAERVLTTARASRQGYCVNPLKVKYLPKEQEIQMTLEIRD
jgi:chemotaxis protein CheD